MRISLSYLQFLRRDSTSILHETINKEGDNQYAVRRTFYTR